MKTMYNKTSNIICFADLRRKSGLAQQDSLARQTKEEPQDNTGFRPVVLEMSRTERRSVRRERHAWYLDACASLAVMFMTLVFALRVLL